LIEDLDYYSRLEYHLSDFSQITLDELQASGRLEEFHEHISFIVFDALDKYSSLEKSSYDILFANYLLDQFPARIFAHTNRGYLEKIYQC
jgi:SAM-dependent MidA family methyltransferase